jgi:hypothetical protein
VRKVTDDRLRAWGARLREFDYEDLVSYLIGVCWELSLRYDPAKDKNPNFGAYAARILTLRVADWYRQRFGDRRHGDRPIVLSLDAPARLGDYEGDGATGGRDRLVETLAGSAGDPAEDRSPDLVGVLQRGGRRQPRPDDQMGEPTARRAEAGAAPPNPPRRVKPRVPGMTKPEKEPPPICTSCAAVFLNAFKRANGLLPEADQVPLEELIARARGRAAAVKLKDHWVCRRCTTVPLSDGTEVPIYRLFPNRQARRDHDFRRGQSK